MTEVLDRRRHAFRPDLADERLAGRVDALRFAKGNPARVTAPVVDLRPTPDLASGIDTQALYGETVTLFEETEGWSWVQLATDGYVGYVPSFTLDEKSPEPGHIVAAVRTFVYESADLKNPATAALSMGSRLGVSEFIELRGTSYAVLADGRAVVADHIAALDAPRPDDYVAIAARFLETPYLWGGRSAFGIDCSGLVQLAMMMAGRDAPRDSDMQAAELGVSIDRGDLRRGDLVFWKGHVAIMEDAETMIHANGKSMTVARERLEAAIDRITPLYGRPTGYRRP